jgi:hypothetical protein
MFVMDGAVGEGKATGIQKAIADCRLDFRLEGYGGEMWNMQSEI